MSGVRGGVGAARHRAVVAVVDVRAVRDVLPLLIRVTGVPIGARDGGRGRRHRGVARRVVREYAARGTGSKSVDGHRAHQQAASQQTASAVCDAPVRNCGRAAVNDEVDVRPGALPVKREPLHAVARIIKNGTHVRARHERAHLEAVPRGRRDDGHPVHQVLRELLRRGRIVGRKGGYRKEKGDGGRHVSSSVSTKRSWCPWGRFSCRW